MGKAQLIELRESLQKLIRLFPDSSFKSPCGVNVSTSCAYAILEINKKRDSDINQKVLAKELCLNKSSITRICAELEMNGFIKVKINNEDKRNKSIVLSAKGDKLVKRRQSQGDLYFGAILKQLPKNKISSVLESLELLSEAICITSTEKNK